MPNPFRPLAESIGRAEAPEARKRFVAAAASRGIQATEDAADLASLLACAYPATAGSIEAWPEDVIAIARGTKRARGAGAPRPPAPGLSGARPEEGGVRPAPRFFARRERLRVA